MGVIGGLDTMTRSKLKKMKNKQYRGYKFKKLYKQWITIIDGKEAGFTTLKEAKLYVDTVIRKAVN